VNVARDLVPVLSEVAAASGLRVQPRDETPDQRRLLSGFAQFRPELAHYAVALDDRRAHSNACDALGNLLPSDVVEHLLATDHRLIGRVLDTV
jgi:hypothetical protein